MESFWDRRYSETEYAYGKNPNLFFKKSISGIPPGKILLPAEGEGRNAVFAAQIGWEVFAFDTSKQALAKAKQLSEEKKVKINYIHSNFDSISLANNYFDCLALIYVHPPEDQRRDIHRQLLKSLRAGGKLILEGFSKNQLNNSSGGPKDINLLFSCEEILEDFSGMKNLRVAEKNIQLNEGIFHQGIASVIRLTGIK
jgi:ubiquinone/menaquinone biosynthesis C-methylase UbiE